MLAGSSGHIHQTPEHRNVAMDNPPERMAAALKCLAGSRLVMNLLCLQVEDDQKKSR